MPRFKKIPNTSRLTIKNYAKFRLLSVVFILMTFDWIQKSAIFAYQRRVARPTTGGRKTRADDVLNRSFHGSGTKYRESHTIAIPPFIRIGIKYKQALFQTFSALFEEFGNPELFGTFTCDDKMPVKLLLPVILEGQKPKLMTILFCLQGIGRGSGFGSGILSQALERAAKDGV
ncbi:hypothetical protein BGZ98_001414 [Dissophora globulifera]|nr:hypothetical protein BGZ98_001414 [Dissophora globulifera]